LLVALLVVSAASTSMATDGSRAAILGLLYRPGAREMALGGAGVASATGHAASYYNPALLAWQDTRMSGGATYYEIPQNFSINDMYYFHSSGALQLGSLGALGLAVTYVSLGEQDRTREDGTSTTYTTYTTVLGATYSSKISDNASAGVNRAFLWISMRGSLRCRDVFYNS